MTVTINKENLTKLADGLAQLPAMAGFDMGEFREGGRLDPRPREDALEAANVCNTAACAIGWGPTIPGLEATRDDLSLAGIGKFRINWNKYSDRLFISSVQSSAWDWCFDCEWQLYDNTVTGAIKRIRYLVDKGVPPRWFQLGVFEDFNRDLYREALAGYSA